MIIEPSGQGPIPWYLDKARSAETEAAARLNQEPRWPLNFIAIWSEVSLWKTFRIRMRITGITHNSVITQ